MSAASKKELDPDILLAIRDQVREELSSRTDEDRLFIKRQLERFGVVAKYMGILFLGVITILGIKTASDLNSVAENLVKSTIEKKDPAAVYRKTIDQLYANILISSGLSAIREKPSFRTTSDRGTGLTDTELNHVLQMILIEEDDVRISFDQGILLLSEAPPPIWNRAANLLLNKLGTDASTGAQSWTYYRPDRAREALDAFIRTEYRPAIVKLRSLITSAGVSAELQARMIKLAAVTGDKDSGRFVAQAFHSSQEERVKSAALDYWIRVSPTAKILADTLEGIKAAKGEAFRDGTASLVGSYCRMDRQKAGPELIAKLENVLLQLFTFGSVVKNSSSHRTVDPDFSDTWTTEPQRGANFRRLGGRQEPQQLDYTIGLKGSGSDTVYRWAFNECADYFMSAVRKELKEPSLWVDPVEALWQLASAVGLEDDGTVLAGLMVRVPASMVTGPATIGRSQVWLWLMSKDGEKFARIFDGAQFAHEVKVPRLSIYDLLDIGLVRFDARQKFYALADVKMKPQ
jgi:hypothetical protein